MENHYEILGFTADMVDKAGEGLGRVVEFFGSSQDPKMVQFGKSLISTPFKMMAVTLNYGIHYSRENENPHPTLSPSTRAALNTLTDVAFSIVNISEFSINMFALLPRESSDAAQRYVNKYHENCEKYSEPNTPFRVFPDGEPDEYLFYYASLASTGFQKDYARFKDDAYHKVHDYADRLKSICNDISSKILGICFKQNLQREYLNIFAKEVNKSLGFRMESVNDAFRPSFSFNFERGENFMQATNEDVQSKLNDLIKSNRGIRDLQETFNKRLNQNQKLLHECLSYGQDNHVKLSMLMRRVDDIHSKMVKYENDAEKAHKQAEILADFQGVIAGFGMIKDLGNLIQNKYIAAAGQIGVAVTQGIFGAAKLAGTFGPIAGFATLNPVALIFSSVLSIGSLFGKKSGDQALKAIRQLSEQICEYHKSYLAHFGIVINGQKYSQEFNKQRFDHLDNCLQHISKVVYEVDWNVQEILAENQRDRINKIREEMKKNRLDTETIINNKTAMDPSRYIEKLNKRLMSLLQDLESCEGKSIDFNDRGNGLNGWFHIGYIDQYLKKRNGLVQNCTLSVPNFIIWSSTLENCFMLLADLSCKYEGVSITKVKICDTADRQIELFNKFLAIVSREEFVESLIRFYSQRLGELSNEFFNIQELIKCNYELLPMKEFVKKNIDLNKSIADTELLRGIITRDTAEMTVPGKVNNKISLIHTEYFQLYKEFRMLLKIYRSLFGVESSELDLIINMYNLEHMAIPHYNNVKGSQKFDDKEVEFHYLVPHEMIRLENCEFSPKVVRGICEQIKNGRDVIRSYLFGASIIIKYSKKNIKILMQETQELPHKFAFFAKTERKACVDTGGQSINCSQHMYDNSDVDSLLRKFTYGFKNITCLYPIMCAKKTNGNMLLDQLQQFKLGSGVTKVENPRKHENIMIPIVLGLDKNDDEGCHWVLVYMDYRKGDEKKVIYYFDPYGHQIDSRIEEILKLVFPKTLIHTSELSLQDEDDVTNCGPWIVAIAERIKNYLSAQSEQNLINYLDEQLGNLNIDMERDRQQNFLHTQFGNQPGN